MAFIIVNILMLMSTIQALFTPGVPDPKTPSGARVPSNNLNGQDLLDKAIQKLGGYKALSRIDNVVYQAPTIYRSQSTMQSYNMFNADVYVSISGAQNMSFSYLSENLIQRIDRRYTRSEYWYFGQPGLEPVQFSLLIHDGTPGTACYVKGNDIVFADPKQTLGYVDQGLARYLTKQANLFSPKLLLAVKSSSQYFNTKTELHPGVYFPSIFDKSKNVTVIFDPETDLPYIIRYQQDHYVLGSYETDLQLTNYTVVNGVQFPRRFLTIVNNESVLEDFLVQQITVNQKVSSQYFQGSSMVKHAAASNRAVSTKEYPPSEIEEYYRNMLWHGPYTQTFGKIKVANPVAGLAKLWHLMFPDADNYENLVLEFDNAVMVLDAPPHQTKLIRQWVEHYLKRKITHLWVTHHHRDHSGGASDIVTEGVSLIIPEVATSYWRQALPDASLITFNDTHPYIYHDKNMQVRFLWRKEAVHALDWSYAIITSACPGPDDGIVAFEADAWSPGTDAIRFDMNFARQWLRQAEGDGLSRNATVVAAHGRNTPEGTPLADLINVAGYSYPALDTTSWKRGGHICLGSWPAYHI